MTKFFISAGLLFCINTSFANEQVKSAKQELPANVEVIEMEGSFVKKGYGILFVSKDGEDFMTFKNSAKKIKNYMNVMVKIKAQAKPGEHRKQLTYIDKIEEINNF